MLKDEKGSGMLFTVFYLVLIFGLLIIGVDLFYQVGTERANINTACVQSSEKIQYSILKSQDGQSGNEYDNKHIVSNSLYFDKQNAINIVTQVFNEYGYTINNVDVSLNDYTLTITGNVALKTKNVLNKLTRNQTLYVPINYHSRIFKNYQE
ncbi:hypothetical protein [Thermoanaerobacterium sp. RBIITD]|uniref:hypothetical protein n=1 Tax=Thermoanaerobacterium sp. RBIITD TaxID=1550240 RepID=UPI000BB95B0D|nr:hypothetical protein [Thermoanaerobacterium sp. RBIITD]SNX54108.1 hypothetical protein SAMN05660242_1741 [Thermoanaerobacterium sp. RBIITD]